MAEGITNELMYETLKALRAEFSGFRSDMRDAKARLSFIESYIATMHTDKA
ncbi:MAG: hypothetical protein KIT17_00955 [Rubrivivax sp.]|nr:hypothetical protein [Rubrivivax sp.]